MSTHLVETELLKREIVAVIALLEDGDVHGAIRRLRGMHVSADLNALMQRTITAAVAASMKNSKEST